MAVFSDILYQLFYGCIMYTYTKFSLGVIQKLRGQEEVFRWSVESLQMVGSMQNVQNFPIEVGRWSESGRSWQTHLIVEYPLKEYSFLSKSPLFSCFINQKK